MTEGLDGNDGLASDSSASANAPISRSPRISREDVFQAADALVLAHQKPTIDRVRTRLGRGSPNTIQEHLEVWWAQLGDRLRDVPGREFPELPDRVALALQKLWNEALDAAHDALGEKISLRERTLLEREEALAAREQQCLAQERAAVARSVALEESLSLAREQLLVANQRAERLEASLDARIAELERLQTQMAARAAEGHELRARLDAATAAHQSERTQLDERYAANEARWLLEIDRGRQSAKEAAKDHERQAKELRAQIDHLQRERGEMKQQVQELRSELRTVLNARAQLEKRLTALTAATVRTARTTPKSSHRRHARTKFGADHQ